MNVIKIAKGQAVSTSILKMIGLAMFLANELDWQEDGAKIESEFGWNNFPSSAYQSIMYSSPHQAVIESFDKPIIESGDIVVAAVTDAQLESAKDNLNEYGQVIDFFTGTPGTHLVVGMANASQTDFFEPFQGITKVVLDTDRIQELLNTYGLEGSNDYHEVAQIVEQVVEQKVLTSALKSS